MRRSDREIKEISKIYGVVQRCQTIRLAMVDKGKPYVVPVSFGAEMINDQIVIYFHCAKEGMKVDILKNSPQVCVEGDVLFKIEPIKHGITARYESFIGFGNCEFLDNIEEKIHGLQVMVNHYGYTNYDLANCLGLEQTLVGKIVLKQVSGKTNPCHEN